MARVALSVVTLRTRQVMAEDSAPVVLEPPVDEHAAAKPPEPQATALA